PGGGSPDKLRAHETPVRFVKSFMQAGKPVMAICHGPQLLLTADEYKGHKMTAWKTIQGDLKKAGGNVVDQEVDDVSAGLLEVALDRLPGGHLVALVLIGGEQQLRPVADRHDRLARLHERLDEPHRRLVRAQLVRAAAAG